MSYGEELAEEMCINQEVAHFESMLPAINGVWRTKNGKLLNISEMGTDHIKNTIKLLERIPEPDESVENYIIVFKKELAQRARIFLVLKEHGILS